MKTPDIKPNPNPKQHYEITMTVDGAPKGFDSVSGSMQYVVKNSDACVAPDPVSGHHSNLAQFLPFDIKKVDEHTYKGTVVTDHFLDADYYGLGVCHWVMSSAMAVFKINGNSIDLRPSILNEDLVAEKSVDVYFPLADLSASDGLKYGDGGQPLAEVSPQIRQAVFHITLSSRKETP
ncbi:hypothetical protein [Dyella silvatica]|uniref:hypothetical protein n=1 Tax=Dyella silvatica TaxID=2992128 RepID=UPI002256DDB9|nr:hypothetical protein [Dyella silvatica]